MQTLPPRWIDMVSIPSISTGSTRWHWLSKLLKNTLIAVSYVRSIYKQPQHYITFMRCAITIFPVHAAA